MYDLCKNNWTIFITAMILETAAFFATGIFFNSLCVLNIVLARCISYPVAAILGWIIGWSAGQQLHKNMLKYGNNQ